MYAGEKIIPDFNLDDPLRLLNYRKAFHCLSDSPIAADLGMNPKKGLLIQGSKGVGKTDLMRVMQKLFKDTERRFKKVNILEIIDLIRSNDFTEMEIKAMYGKALKRDLYIDDLGFGQVDMNRFGSYVNIVGEIIYEREELWTQEGFLTHYSTNIRTTRKRDENGRILEDDKRPSLELLYGDRVFDRIKHKTNLINWTGDSLR